MGTGNTGQGGSSEEKVADRGGGSCKGGKEGKQVESCKAAVGKLQPGQAVQGQLLEALPHVLQSSPAARIMLPGLRKYCHGA